MILELDEEMVVITKEGKTLPETKEILKRKNFHDIITYVYWVYKKDNICQNQLISKKRISTCRIYLPDYKPEDFENDRVIRAFIDVYQDLQCTHTERLYERWKEDVEEYLNHLAKVPYKTTGKVKRQVGDTLIEEVVEIENFEEKNKAIKLVESLMDTGLKLKQKIIQEGPKAKKGSGRLFDNT